MRILRYIVVMAAMVIVALTLRAQEAGSGGSLSYAWRLMPPLGLHEEATIDTLLYNYFRQAIPSAVSAAYATTGNTASPGMNMIFSERQRMSDFYFRDALQPWLPSYSKQRFYNTRIPMTLASYNFGGGRNNSQDRLQAVFSGNAGPRWQVGALIDYIHTKGSYNYQAAKNLTWGASASYMGDRYEMQTFFYHYNNFNMDNGGITDPLYITDPAQLQGGTSHIDPKSIPTRLTEARTRVKGTEFYLNNRYKIGYWHEERDSLRDSVVHRMFVPVSSFIHTLDFNEGKHRFADKNASESAKYWDNTYFTPGAFDDFTTYWSLRNTLGVSMIEGFHRLAKFGLAAYATYEVRRYNQAPYEMPDYGSSGASSLTPLPIAALPKQRTTESLLYVGAQLTKQRGAILRYEATGELGLAGPAVGDVDIKGNISTRIPLLGDTAAVTAYGAFSNLHAPLLMKQYISNHFVWDNDFGKERRVKFGGNIKVPQSGTSIDVGVQNIQNYIYFGSDMLPVQNSGNVQVFHATLKQDLHAGILHWNNSITYQTSSNNAVIPLPKLAVYSNLYLWFRVARVLQCQVGVDCDYYTRYTAPSYQPATMAFYNQQEQKVGNYPFCNLYINMKLSKARFYIMWSHVNQGLFGGKNYFSMPDYPLNPRRFQLGVSVDFAN